MSKQYGLRRRLKRLAKADGIPIGRLSDWTPEQIADAIADKWNAEWQEWTEAGYAPPTFKDLAGIAGEPDPDDECPF